MTRRILVPLDGSEQSHDALELALSAFGDAEVTTYHVIDPIEGGYTVRAGIPISSEEWYEDAKEEAERLHAEAREVAEAHGATLESETEVGRPAQAIVDHAEEEGFDHIVVGSHGRSGVPRILLGSVAETVVRRSSVPVTVVR